MDRWLLGFSVGAILALLPPQVPALFYECLLIIVTLFGLLVSQWRTLMCIMIGALWILNHGDAYNTIWADNEIHTEQFFRQQHPVLLEVIDIPVTTQSGLRFTARIIEINQQSLPRAIKVRLNWRNLAYGKTTDKQADKQAGQSSNQAELPLLLQQGDLLSTNIKIKPAHGLANQGSFNYQRWLRANGVHATGYVVTRQKTVAQNVESIQHSTEPQPQLAQITAFKHVKVGNSVRERLYQRVMRLTEGFSHQALILALLFGERALFDEQIWQVLQATGTQHLVAISGLHVGLVVVIAYFCSAVVRRAIPFHLFSPNVQQWLTKRYTQFFTLAFSAIVAVFYCYLAGFSIPTVRALIFFLLLAAGQLLPIRLSPTRLMLLSVVVTILLIPSSVYSASFWLSYLAVAAIMLVYWRFGFWLGKVPQSLPTPQKKKPEKMLKQVVNKTVQKVVGFMLIQLGIVVLLMPVTALLFGQVSTMSVLANSIALPLVGLLVMPLLFIAMVLLALSETLFGLVAGVANMTLEWLWLFLCWVSATPNASLALSSEQTLLICLVVLLLILLTLFTPKILTPKIFTPKWQHRSHHQQAKGEGIKAFMPNKTLLTTGVAVGAIALLSGYVPAPKRQWQVTVLDVGQGLAVVISQGDKAILYDTGNVYPSGFNLAKQAVLPYLKHQGLTLDYLIISHDDSDHAAGAPQVITAYPDAKLVFNGEFTVATATGTEKEPCQQGKTLAWQGLTLTMLWPKTLAAAHNDDSCVIRVSDGKTSVLLTGDITKKVERALIRETTASNLASDIVIAPHHGSKSSSSKDFIKHLEAKAVVFSAGYLNQWKMPNQQVLARYQDANTQVFSTAQDGLVQFSISTDASAGQRYWQVHTYRADISPYWFNN
ncbi:DNA internalization-related competence protein ComEC/Rec2 [Thalassotalea euphylliae]|uniref:DNA internalization-related competence protein ComEC/Rec2 n=1 Tax=Thalassotalea euphylliae TaxID=1655234 RepID=A0A3E0TTP0_9GAMM|nr:DNA internalization-related competence protein ComEC/Rec2 [Thalassotalea euphylliae]REL27717.1 DNA internalization-related competence protein ComEC/Rec2 [Thalassotalea euphylliae]